jgi:hypothetical protein
MKEYFNLLPIFKFIEKTIGAKVKYWFLNLSRFEDDKEMLKFVEKNIWNDSRSVQFPPIHLDVKFFDHFIEAEHQIYERGLRICDNPEKYKSQKTFLPNEDRHPDQNGQKFIAKYILLSIDNTVDLTEFDNIEIKKIKRLL